MRNRFSIGELSKLMNVPVKTLRYYDDIGLFRPIEVSPHNGYRYYSSEQFEQLDSILYLRQIGVSLHEIKTQINSRKPEDFLQLLKKQAQETTRKIQELERIRQRFGSRIRELENALLVTHVGEPQFQLFSERLLLRLNESISSGLDLEMALRKLGKMSRSAQSMIFIGKVGLTVSYDNLQSRNFQEYSSIFIVLDEPVSPADMVFTLPAGRYACIFYHGSHNDSPPYYNTLLEYIRAQGYQIAGESIERTVIGQFVANDPERFLTEIQIPVKKY